MTSIVPSAVVSTISSMVVGGEAAILDLSVEPLSVNRRDARIAFTPFSPPLPLPLPPPSLPSLPNFHAPHAFIIFPSSDSVSCM